MLSSLTANAQFGDVLRKAAQKAAQKTTEKLTDKAAEKAADAIEKELDKSKAKNAPAENNAEAEQATYASIMAQMPDLPTVQQLVNYKEAELNEQSLKLMVSPVTSFQTKLLGLSVQAVSLTTSSADSAQIVDAAYKNAQLATGLTREELDELAALPEDQQQAYLQAHYKQGTAEAALLQQAADASKYLEPIQPIIDRWETFNKTIDQLYSQTESQCKEIYKKYAGQLSKATGKDRNKTLIKYYSEIAPLMRTAVQQALKISLNEQLPACRHAGARPCRRGDRTADGAHPRTAPGHHLRPAQLPPAHRLAILHRTRPSARHTRVRRIAPHDRRCPLPVPPDAILTGGIRYIIRH